MSEFNVRDSIKKQCEFASNHANPLIAICIERLAETLEMDCPAALGTRNGGETLGSDW